MLKRASRPDQIRWKPLPPAPDQFLKRFPEMRPFFDNLSTVWNENESAIRRALEAIPDASELSRLAAGEDELSAQEEKRVREIIAEMLAGIPMASQSWVNNLFQTFITQITNMIEDKPPGGGGGGGTPRKTKYLHLQPIPDTVWHVHHNLNDLPDVLVMDTDGLKFLCDILYIDNNNLDLLHTIPMAGSALCTI